MGLNCRKNVAVVSAAVAVFAFHRKSMAASDSFTYSVSGTTQWETLTNWSLQRVPEFTDDAFIDVTGLSLTVHLTQPEAANSLEVGGSSITLDLGAGTLALTNNLIVGQNGNANLTVQNGVLNAGTIATYIGYNHASTSFAAGTLNVTGTGTGTAAFLSAGDIFVGGEAANSTAPVGTGTLIVSGGATVATTAANTANGEIQIGYNGFGMASVTGMGSSLASGSDLVLGNSGGTGLLFLTNNASASVGNDLYVGAGYSLGTLTASGDATLSVGGNLNVGVFGGQGSLLISDGATVATTGAGTNSSIQIGFHGDGYAAVTGSTSNVSTVGDLILGNNGGSGTFVLSENATVSVAGNLYIGAGYSFGTLSASSGASTYVSRNILIGSVGGQGTAAFNGSAITGNTLAVGLYGSGTMSASNSSTVTNSVTYVGFNSQSKGQLTINDSTFTTAEVNVGYGDETLANGSIAAAVGTPGVGTLVLTGGAQAILNGDVSVGWLGGVGTMVVDGANSGSGPVTTATVSGGGIYIGTESADTTNASAGTLIVRGGAQVSAVGPLDIGDQGGIGYGVIDGATTVVTAPGGLQMGGISGGGGTGQLTISNGATVNASNGNSVESLISASGGVATLNVSGGGSNFRTDELSFAEGSDPAAGTSPLAAQAAINITGGGTVSVGEFLSFVDHGGIGTISVSGSGSSFSSPTGAVFASGLVTGNGAVLQSQGTINVLDSGVASFSSLTLSEQGGISTVSISSGGLLHVDGLLSVAANYGTANSTNYPSQSTITITGGSLTSGSAYVGYADAGTPVTPIANITLSGSNASWVNQGTAANGQNGQLTVGSGGAVAVSNNASLITTSLDISQAASFTVPSGHLTVTGGNLSVPGGKATTIGDGTSHASLTLTNASVSVPSGDGTILISSGATLAAHGEVPTAAAVALTSGSTLQMSVGGSPSNPGTDYDQIAISSTFDAGGATLEIQPLANLELSTLYPIVTVAGGGSINTTDHFAVLLEGPNASSAPSYNVIYSSSQIDVEFGSTDATPEPTSVALFSIVASPLLLSRRRRRLSQPSLSQDAGGS